MKFEIVVIRVAAGFLAGLCLARGTINLIAGKKGRFAALLDWAAVLCGIVGAALAALAAVR